MTERGEKFIVYAPRDAANPDDLRAYPKPTEGFQDHRGEFIKYDPNTPELLDSLPRQGQPPVRPYSEVSDVSCMRELRLIGECVSSLVCSIRRSMKWTVRIAVSVTARIVAGSKRTQT